MHGKYSFYFVQQKRGIQRFLGVSGTPVNKKLYCQEGNYTLVVCRKEIGSQIELWLYSNCEVGTWPENITRFITFDGFQIA